VAPYDSTLGTASCTVLVTSPLSLRNSTSVRTGAPLSSVTVLTFRGRQSLIRFIQSGASVSPPGSRGSCRVTFRRASDHIAAQHHDAITNAPDHHQCGPTPTLIANRNARLDVVPASPARNGVLRWSANCHAW
jgi:hypothetical protein